MNCTILFSVDLWQADRLAQSPDCLATRPRLVGLITSFIFSKEQTDGCHHRSKTSSIDPPIRADARQGPERSVISERASPAARIGVFAPLFWGKMRELLQPSGMHPTCGKACKRSWPPPKVCRLRSEVAGGF